MTAVLQYPLSKIMGNNSYCLNQNQKILTSQQNHQSIVMGKDILIGLVPTRTKQTQQIYQKLIGEKPLSYSIESVKGQYQPITISIFGQQGIYLGSVNGGKPHGHGQLYFDNKNFLQANFKAGQIDSDDAIMIEKNGNFYRGGFKESIQTGPGTLRTSGCQWNGQFISGKLSGSGKLISEDGNRYQGTFSNGKMEGKGKLTYKNGDFFEGFFKQGKRNGIGSYKSKNYEYHGPYMSDMKQGKGTLIFPNGAKFQGWFSRDKLHGYGQYFNKAGKMNKFNYQFAQLHTLF